MSPDDDDDVYYYMARDMNESCPPMTERCPALIPPFTTRSSSVMDLNRVMSRLESVMDLNRVMSRFESSHVPPFTTRSSTQTHPPSSAIVANIVVSSKYRRRLLLPHALQSVT